MAKQLYLVHYKIPEFPRPDNRGETEDFEYSVYSALKEDRSTDYDAVYKRLDEIGSHIITSAYISAYDGTAEELREFIVRGLPQDVLSRIQLLITEFPEKNFATWPPRRQK